MKTHQPTFCSGPLLIVAVCWVSGSDMINETQSLRSWSPYRPMFALLLQPFFDLAKLSYFRVRNEEIWYLQFWRGEKRSHEGQPVLVCTPSLNISVFCYLVIKVLQMQRGSIWFIHLVLKTGIYSGISHWDKNKSVFLVAPQIVFLYFFKIIYIQPINLPK